MRNLYQTVLAISLFVLTGFASAAVITGTVEFDGGYTTDTGDKDTATVFTFLNPISVTAATGSFAPLSGGTVTYNPLDVSIPFTPITPLWSATVASVDYSFELDNITLDTLVAGFRLIKGSGTFAIGADSQYGDWSFSTQGGGSGGVFSFSASQVPEPGIALLLGAGLIGFGVSRKLRKTA